MKRVEACEKKFSQLFGERPNQGEGTDPELTRILQRFVYGQVYQTGSLDDKTRELITCVILATQQALPQLQSHTAAALAVGLTPLEVREAVYGCMPFIGCPKTLNAVEAINAVFTERGIALPLENAARVEEAERFEQGSAIQYPIYGDEIVNVMSSLPAEFARAFPRFLTEYCFGDFYTRAGLSTRTRELLYLVILIALGGCEAQVKAHAKGCLATGSSAEEIYSAVAQALPYVGFPRAFNAVYAIREALAG